MLVISRKVGERIKIGNNIWVVVVRAGAYGNVVRLGIDAPADVNILREELLEPSAPLAPLSAIALDSVSPSTEA